MVGCNALTVQKIKEHIDKKNLTVTQDSVKNEICERISNNLMNMAPKKIGTILEKIVRAEFSIDVNGHINAENDGLCQVSTIEIKSSRAMFETDSDKKASLYSFVANYQRGLVSLADLETSNFVCNIQQVKPKLFNRLYYVLLVKEGLLIFKIANNQIVNDSNITYSNKQHRGNTDEGQFHIKKSNINYHIETYYDRMIGWERIIDILQTLN